MTSSPVSLCPALGLAFVVASTVVSTVAFGPSPASAEPLQLGGLIGPRIFSDQSKLGQKESPQTSLGSTIIVGVRVGKPVTSWLAVELEVPISPATTQTGDIGVFWMEPRAQLKFQLPAGRVHPFFLLGGGAPITVSNNDMFYPGGVTGEGYGGGGVTFRPGRGVGLRLDLRVSVQPARDTANWKVTSEGELLASLWFEPKRRRKQAAATTVIVAAPIDTDRDGFVDSADGCKDRPEDRDGFEDHDGCPDIDNDGDLVLDIADRCPVERETFNGFEDDDGCPDQVPADVDGIIGTVEGLNYAPGVTEVAPTAMPPIDMIAEILRRHPTIRIVIVGHTDDIEAVNAAPPVAEGDPAPDPELLATQLGQARAQAVRDQLVKRGLGSSRFVVVSVGLGEPVSDSSPRGRGRNRRVELKLFVPRRDR